MKSLLFLFLFAYSVSAQIQEAPYQQDVQSFKWYNEIANTTQVLTIVGTDSAFSPIFHDLFKWDSTKIRIRVPAGDSCQLHIFPIYGVGNGTSTGNSWLYGAPFDSIKSTGGAVDKVIDLQKTLITDGVDIIIGLRGYTTVAVPTGNPSGNSADLRPLFNRYIRDRKHTKFTTTEGM